MNKWKEFAKIFNLKLNQSFYIEDDEEELIYRFTKNGLESTYSDDAEDDEWNHCIYWREICTDMIDGTISIKKA